MRLRNFFSNGEGPQATGEVPIHRQCGIIMDRGSYGERCFKQKGHRDHHEGAFMDLAELNFEKSNPTGEAIIKAYADSSPNALVVHEPRNGDAPVATAHPMLAPVLTQLQAINDRFSRFESNVHQLNLVAGELVNKVLTPLKGELEQLRYNLGDKANSTVSMLERLVGHVDKQLDIALKLTGANAVHYRDEHGCHGDVPSITELTESGVKASPEGSALAASAENLLAQLEQVRAENMRLTRENAQLKASGYGE